jgi:hypothetical protein
MIMTFLKSPDGQSTNDNDLECHGHTWTDENGKVNGIHFVLRVPRNTNPEEIAPPTKPEK